MTSTAPRRRHQLIVALLAAVAGLVAAAVAEPPKAAAHSDLTATTPAAGSRETTPKSVVLTFSDEVEPTFARVTLAIDEAEPVALSTEVVDSEVRATPPEPARTGGQQEWKVAYRVVSGDGHPITGTVAFSVVPAATGQSAAGQDTAVPTPTPSVAPTPVTSPSPTPAPGSATPTSTVRPGYPAESDVHGNRSRTWPFVLIMGGLLLVAPIMAGLFRLLPEDPGGVIAAQAVAEAQRRHDDVEAPAPDDDTARDRQDGNSGDGDGRPVDPPTPT